mmetsp:Transcript_24028/g.59683  ORF Transcript_24028/g.59683 Transcript_24028/m.59683 type:complete len:274 (-) Transcript_24028:117-938(-)
MSLTALALALFTSGVLAQQACNRVTGGTCGTITEIPGSPGTCTTGVESCPERYVLDAAGTCLCNVDSANGLVPGEGEGSTVECSLSPISSVIGLTCGAVCSVPQGTPYSISSFSQPLGGGDIISFGLASGFVLFVSCNSYSLDSIVVNLESFNAFDNGVQGLLYALNDDNTVDQANPVAVFNQISPTPTDNNARDYSLTALSGPAKLGTGRYVFAMVCVIEACNFIWNGPDSNTVVSTTPEIFFVTYVSFLEGNFQPAETAFFFNQQGSVVPP